MSVCARKGACSTVRVCMHTLTRTVYLIPARLAPSMPALPLLQQLAHNVSPLGVTKEEKNRGEGEDVVRGEGKVRSVSG